MSGCYSVAIIRWPCCWRAAVNPNPPVQKTYARSGRVVRNSTPDFGAEPQIRRVGLRKAQLFSHFFKLLWFLNMRWVYSTRQTRPVLRYQVAALLPAAGRIYNNAVAFSEVQIG